MVRAYRCSTWGVIAVKGEGQRDAVDLTCCGNWRWWSPRLGGRGRDRNPHPSVDLVDGMEFTGGRTWWRDPTPGDPPWKETDTLHEGKGRKEYSNMREKSVEVR